MRALLRAPCATGLVVAALACDAPDTDAAERASSDCEAPPALGDGIVRLGDEGRFEVDGEAFLPQGINSYPLLQHAGEGRFDAIEDIFAQAVALGRPLLRTPAFMDGGENAARIRDVDGTLRDEGLAALDGVLSAAAEHGVRLILILANNWDDFGGAPAIVEMIAPGERLPKNAFWSDPRAIADQLAYQELLVTRVNSLSGRVYGEDPTIFAWELVNEARCERERTPELCDDRTLVRWAKQMSDGLRASGAQQLIAWGGGGALGEYGEDLRAIGRDGGVDVLTLHMYASSIRGITGARRAEVAIAWGEATIRERARVARELGMPLLLEEVNWKPDAGSDRDGERATVLDAWLGLAENLGVGALPWMIGEQARVDHDGYLIRTDDVATVDVLRCDPGTPSRS
jgi:mannan endo-1,4-beta-mannosidase